MLLLFLNLTSKFLVALKLARTIELLLVRTWWGVSRSILEFESFWVRKIDAAAEWWKSTKVDKYGPKNVFYERQKRTSVHFIQYMSSADWCEKIVIKSLYTIIHARIQVYYIHMKVCFCFSPQNNRIKYIYIFHEVYTGVGTWHTKKNLPLPHVLFWSDFGGPHLKSGRWIFVIFFGGSSGGFYDKNPIGFLS